MNKNKSVFAQLLQKRYIYQEMIHIAMTIRAGMI